MEVLNVACSGVLSDDDITGIGYHSHESYNRKYNVNDEIRIPIQQQDIYTLPSESYLHLEYKLTNAAGTQALDASHCVSGFFANLFSEIRYEIDGIEVDSIQNSGVASLMKNAMTFERDEQTKMEAAGYKFDANNGFTTFFEGSQVWSGVEEGPDVINQLIGEIIALDLSFYTYYHN